MAKLYTSDGKILSDNFSQLSVGDRLLRIDTRKSTFDKMQEAVKNATDGNEDRIILEYALGKDQLEYVDSLDLSVKGSMNLLIYIQAAIYDVSFEEAEARFQKAERQA